MAQSDKGVTLREHLEALYMAQMRAIGERLDGHDRHHVLIAEALRATERVLDIRLATIEKNIDAQSASFATANASTHTSITDLMAWKANLEGRVWALVVFIPLVISITTGLILHTLQP